MPRLVRKTPRHLFLEFSLPGNGAANMPSSFLNSEIGG